MAAKVNPIPKGYEGVTPYLIVKGAADALDFYKKVFGAVELYHLDAPGGLIGHAEFKIRDAIIMIADEQPEMDIRGPKSIGGSPLGLMVYFDDVDAVVAKAVAAGAKITSPIENQFYGDRSGKIEDPFGHVWNIATHIEDVSPEEIDKRVAAMYGTK